MADEKTGLEIAVVGMACRLPKSNNIYEFWNNLKHGIECIEFCDDNELRQKGYDDEIINNPEFIKTKGGVIDDEDRFDYEFFNYTPIEAEIMDPQIRLAHEIVWEALEDSGYLSFQNISVGLFMSASSNIMWEGNLLINNKSEELGSILTSLYADKDQLANRIAYKFNFKGPVVNINTACSSSLVGVHMACQSLLNGECDMAIAGGMNIDLFAQTGYFYQQGSILSRDGHCRAFDDEASGTVPGQGGGVVVLKLLEDALNSNDHIVGVIKSSFINNDGKYKAGFTSPGIEGQKEVVSMALKLADIEARSISYIESHGTGTILGDPIEFEALKQAFNSKEKNYCAVGSVKTNIGHLNVASGVAGLIKTLLALRFKEIPPSLNYNSPNKKIDFKNSPFFINSKLTVWNSSDYIRRAGVSSFGIGGTNAHLILEEAPSAVKNDESEKSQLILLSARTKESLDKTLRNLKTYLEVSNENLSLSDLSYTLKLYRKNFNCRCKIVCSTIDECKRILSKDEERKIHQYELNQNNPALIFVFGGMGSQYVKLGLGLYNHVNYFKKEFDKCSLIYEQFNIDIKKYLYPLDQESEMDNFIKKDIQVGHHIIFVVEYCLAKLLLHWGLIPDAMIGYSFGEYVTACISGVIDLKDAVKIIHRRGELLNALPEGAMLSVPLSRPELSTVLPENVSIAIDNGSTCIVSGEVEKIKEFELTLKNKRLICNYLTMPRALHSKAMENITDALGEAFANVHLNVPEIKYISNVTGNWITDEEATNPKYWAKHLSQTVLFNDGINMLVEAFDHSIFLEIGSGGEISALINRELPKGSDHKVVNIIRNVNHEICDYKYLLDKLGTLWLYGKDINWNKFYEGEYRNKISAPTYGFDHSKNLNIAKGNKEPISIQSIIKRLNKNSGDSSNSLFIPTWKKQELANNGDEVDKDIRCKYIIFSDGHGIGNHLFGRFEKKDAIIVCQGTKYQKKDNNEYIIDIKNQGDYLRLLQDTGSKKTSQLKIIHLWSLDSRKTNINEYEDYCKKSWEFGFYSLLYIAQALIKTDLIKDLSEIHDLSDFIKIFVITGGVYEIIGTETLNPEDSTVVGLCKTIPLELPNVICKNIDLNEKEINKKNLNNITDMLFKEFNSLNDSNTVSFIGKSRWIQCFDGIDLSGRKSMLREKGVYIISGGLGVDSYYRAKFLLKEYNAKLALITRTIMPEEEEWPGILEKGNKSDEFYKKVDRANQLRKISKDFIIVSADVSNEQQMKNAIYSTEKKFGAINGVIHAAGITTVESSTLISDLRPENMGMHATSKIFGVEILYRLLKDKKIDFCLLTSSIASYIGGVGLSAYTASCIFMNTFSTKINRQSNFPWICLNWQGNPEDKTIDAFRQIVALPVYKHLIFSQSDLSSLISERYAKEINSDSSGNDSNNKEEFSRINLSNGYIAPISKNEKLLVEIFESLFGYNNIGIDDNFFELGGDSLRAVALISQIYKKMRKKVTIENVLKKGTVRQLSKLLQANESWDTIKVAEKAEYYSCTRDQERIFFNNEFMHDSSYNSINLWKFIGEIDVIKLENAFRRLIHRHQIFRTYFDVVDDKIVQKVTDNLEFKIDRIECLEEEIDTTLDKYNIHFNLKKLPLIKVALINVENKYFILVFLTHHIISDGVSVNVIVNELFRLYSSNDLAELTLQYKDYSQWLYKKSFDNMEKQKEFWLTMFEGEIIELNLPVDFHWSKNSPIKGKIIYSEICLSDTDRTKELAKRENTTIFNILLTVYFIFLSKICNQNDIIVGTGLHGRNHPLLTDMVGLFAQTVAVRHIIDPNISFLEILKQVSINMNMVMNNQEYSFLDLIEELTKSGKIGRNSRNRLFNTLFGLYEFDIKNNSSVIVPQYDNLKLMPISTGVMDIVSDLYFGAYQSDKNLVLFVQFALELFKKSTIEKLVEEYKAILSKVLENPQILIKDIQNQSELSVVNNDIDDKEFKFDF